MIFDSGRGFQHGFYGLAVLPFYVSLLRRVTFVSIDKSTPAEQKTKTVCTVYPQRNSIKAKLLSK